jgi:predicted P-loop ATPase
MSTSNAGNGEQQKTQTEVEQDAGRRAAARYRIAALAVPPKKINGAAASSPPTFDPSMKVETGIVSAVTAKHAQTESINGETPPGETPPGEKPGPNAGQAKQGGTSPPPPNALSGDTDAAIEFLQDRAVTHLSWHPQLSFKRTDPITGEEAENFETASFARDANGNPDWDKVRRWITNRQGRGNIYWTVNAAKPKNKKPAKKDIETVVSLHVDLDPRANEDQDAAEERLTKELEGYHHHASIIIKSGGGAWGIYDLVEPIPINGDPDKIKDAESYNIALAHDLGGDNCQNIDRVSRLPGTINVPNAKKRAKGRRDKLASVHSRSQVRHAIESFTKAVVDAVNEANRASPVGQEATDIRIDWSKVNRPGWLKSVADLPDGAPAKLRHIIGHSGTLKELNEDLIERGLLTKGYGSWSDVTHAIAASLKIYGKHRPDQIAEALLADLPCNRHITNQKDKERAIERAIKRSHNPKPNVSGHWPDGHDDKTGKPEKGILNTIEAIKRAGITCTWDEFRQKEYWTGHDDKKFDGEVSDAAVTVTRRNLKIKFRLYPEVTETRDAITCACRDNKSNPVLDYFAGLKWDGTPRLDKLLHKYLGADDTPLNDAVSRKVMCAIVRRAKKPGCKFDHQLVLQSPQGRKKSMFCEDLAVFPDLYTDAGDLSGTIKEQMEIIQGKQIIEFPELAGYSRASREHNKAMLSRKVDRARLSYAHYATDAPRSSIPIASTNEDHYLNDPTGERRYWHVAVIHYDRDAFLADKDQLYAEAVAREAAEKLWLDTPELQAAHDAVAAGAKEPNELVDLLADLHGEAWHVDGKEEERVSTADIRAHLGMQPVDAARSHGIGRRILDAMKALGWTKARGTLRCHKKQGPMIGGTPDPSYTQPTKGYTRPLSSGPGPTGGSGAHGSTGVQGNSSLGLTGPTGATGATGAPASTGPGPTGPIGSAGAADVTNGSTLDRLLAQGMAQARADHALVRQSS